MNVPHEVNAIEHFIYFLFEMLTIHHRVTVQGKPQVCKDENPVK